MSTAAGLTDAQARELLRLLAIYCREAEGVQENLHTLRVTEVAGDLYDSLPSELSRQTDVCLDAQACRADSMSLPIEYRS